VDEFTDVFTGSGCREGEYHIELDDTVEPVIHPPRRVPQAKLQELEDKDFIPKVDRPTPWVNSLICREAQHTLVPINQISGLPQLAQANLVARDSVHRSLLGYFRSYTGKSVRR